MSLPSFGNSFCAYMQRLTNARSASIGHKSDSRFEASPNQSPSQTAPSTPSTTRSASKRPSKKKAYGTKRAEAKTVMAAATGSGAAGPSGWDCLLTVVVMLAVVKLRSVSGLIFRRQYGRGMRCQATRLILLFPISDVAPIAAPSPSSKKDDMEPA